MLDELKIKIQEKLNIEISSLRFLSSGNQCKIYVIESENKNYIAKKSEANSKNNLLIEAKMIEFLAKNSQILVPKIYFKDDNLIVMEYIENNDYQQHQIAFAKDLAQLHMISNDQYGLEFDNLIGSLPQSNKLNQNWSDFFIFERILFMSKLCYEKKRMDLSFLKKIEAFCIKIPQYLTNNNKPSLIHGDLWQGNILCNNESQIFLIDPAIYFADYEIELAFTTMFNSFDPKFYQYYNSYNPIQPGFFEERKDIYLIYPNLVHLSLFGGFYLNNIENILKKFS